MSKRPNTFGAIAALMLTAFALPVSAQKRPVTQPIVTAAIAGQGVAILPFTMLIVEPELEPGTVVGDRVTLLRWADSLLLEGAQSRAPEVQWIAPQELRKLARRGAGLLPDPDQMGQSIMRSWSLNSVPDPLRSNLRRMTAMAGGWRYVLIPASLIFRPDTTGALSADLSILLADTRTGKVVWRSVAKGAGGTQDQVLGKAIATVFRVEGSEPE